MSRRSPDPAKLLRAFERTKDGVYAVDSDDRIVLWNRAAEKILGFRAEDVLGRRCYEVIAGDDYCEHAVCGPGCDVIKRARRGRGSNSFDVAARTASGKMRLLNVSIVVLNGRRDRSSFAVHLFRDISEARRVQLQVQEELAEVGSPSGDGAGAEAFARLTLREAEVLRLLATGLSNATIAEVLRISPTTVRNHIERVLAKLEVHSKLEAVVYAARHRMV